MQAPRPASRKIVGAGAGFEPAELFRLVGEQAVRPGQDLLLEFSAMGLAHQHQAGLDLGLGHDLRPVEIAVGPGGDDVGHIDRVVLPAQQMVGAGERDEALGMPGGDENVRGIVDADQIVGRRMEHQQRLAQVGEAFVELLRGDVVEEFALDAERPPGELPLRPRPGP